VTGTGLAAAGTLREGVAVGVAAGAEAVADGAGDDVDGGADAAGDDVDGRGDEGAVWDAPGVALPPAQAARRPSAMPDSTSRESSDILTIHCV
jgi:hypothetical protein